MSYAWLRAARRWFCAGSARVRFNRVSSWRDFGAFVGSGGGARLEGSFPLIV